MKISKPIALLLAASLCLLLFSACGAESVEPMEEEGNLPTASENTQDLPTEPSTEQSIIFAYGENDIQAKTSYTVTTASPDNAQMKLPVAVNAKGEPVLTNGDLQVYFWLSYYDFMSQYGSYAEALLGFSYDVPLAQQPSIMENHTWEQYFLEVSLQQYAENYAMAMAAYADGYTFSEEEQEIIDDIADPNGDFAADAQVYGYESVDAYVQVNFGLGVDTETYREYMSLYYPAYYFYNSNLTRIEEEATDEAMEAYYAENTEVLSEKRILNVNNVSVRHILIQPEGERDMVTGAYPEEAWLAAEAEIHDIYSRWQADPTEENFIALAQELTDDTASAESGGLCENFDTATMVQEFSDWSFDQSRQPGDTGIVKTEYGYHLVYFVEQTETRGWIDLTRNHYVGETISALVQKTVEDYPIQVDYSQIAIFDVVSYHNTIEGNLQESNPDEPVG